MYDELSPLDGRYKDRLKGLGDYFSEFALMRARCEVELRYLAALDKTDLFPPLGKEERARIEERISSFAEEDFERIKGIEGRIGHDLKACEVFLRGVLDLKNPNLIHFGLTSEDINNLAYGLILTRYRNRIQLPQLRDLIATLLDLVERWKGIPFLARTHGQPASPTTAGKEMAVFLERFVRQAEKLEGLRFKGKLNGATGNYSALTAAFPDYDWEGFAERFVSGLGLEPNPATTQVEDGDHLAEYLTIVERIDTILLDLDLDIWEYISRGEIVQIADPDEVGSSTMPHKVNPIRFETSEGNVKIANAILHALATGLTHSR
ncbi:adenylosuccinate lyase, partial [Candidatus Acetothermia bacterium]